MKRNRRITFSRLGIHFETDVGMVNAHWNDLRGCGLIHSIPFYRLKSMVRFWRQIGIGLIFLMKS